MSEVRLIDANALKYKNLAEVNGRLTYVLTAEDIDNAPTVEITEEQAIDKLHETGWLIRHDKEMTERPHIIDNCDMNVFEPEKYMEGGAE